MPVTAGGAGELRRGWPVLLGAAIGMGSGIAMFVGLTGFFLKPITAEFGWGRGAVSLFALAPLLTALMMPAMGWLVDRYGTIRFVIGGAVAFAIAYLGLAAMPNSYGVFVALVAFIGALAGPLSSALVFTRILIGAFDRWRGLALSVGMSGGFALSIPLFPVLAAVIQDHGWRAGFALMAPISLALGLISAALLRRGTVAATAGEGEVAGTEFGTALRSPQFWLLLIAMVLATLAAGGVLIHLQPLLSDKGLDAAAVALYASTFSAAVIGGRLAIGVLLDRMWPPLIGAVSIALPIPGMLALAGDGLSPAELTVAVVFAGLGQGAEGSLLGFFCAYYFGQRAFGRIFGLLGLAYGLAFAAGAALTGAAFDAYRGYDAALVVGALLSLAGSAALLLSARSWGRD